MSSFRPARPVSSLSKTSTNLTATIDDLALIFTSETPSLEPSSHLTCCCQEECENYQAWQAMKLRVDNQLTLSASVGHALLQRYYQLKENQSFLKSNEEDSDTQITELLRAKHSLEKQFNQALANSEANESSLESLHQELEEAHATIDRLLISNTKYVDLEGRLEKVSRERDDIQQERDFESQRARSAESRLVTTKDKIEKLHLEVQRLKDELKQKSALKMESTSSVVQTAKSQARTLYHKLGSSSTIESVKLTQSLEALSRHNDSLKQHNKELEILLAESREELNSLRQEVEERQVNTPMRPTLESKEIQERKELSGSHLERDSSLIDTTHVAVESKIEHHSRVNVRSQVSLKTTKSTRVISSQLFFLVGMTSYWFYCAKAFLNTMTEYGSRPGLVGFLLPGILSFTLLRNATSVQNPGFLHKPIMVDIATFIGTLCCTFVGWWVISMIEEFGSQN
ncbi:hypothetical protein GG344DRAFT_81186 [Lentinula edodes]|nr:hypothetical protein GG344DRAFT_81186 [Lentinula edodes]